MLKSVLIANRGEIACRVIRTARRLGVRTIAVYSDVDATALHVREADEAVHIGPAPARDSYLQGDRIIAAAHATSAEAIHPGYGFLSENADFAAAVIAAGLIWVGPKPASIRAMGLKDAAKKLMQEAGVPTTPGYLGENQDVGRLKAEADAIGYPVLIKAVAGGGGKGMRRVDAPGDFIDALASCKREAANSFGDERVLIEKYILAPRHIEVQVFGDAQGNVVHLFERDCSLQRRHQKVIEEAPAPGMDEATREAVCSAAVRAARAVDYEGAGTIEFIADASDGLRADRIWFMEMNTRLQVEHPVTEAITAQDLVEWQLRVASGEALPVRQDQLVIRGHALEARLYAEDPAKGFLPSIGALERFRLPTRIPATSWPANETRVSADAAVPGDVRIETGVDEGSRVSPYYDPMIAKLICHAEDRDTAIRGLAAVVGAAEVWPLRTNAAFLHALLITPDFRRGSVHTAFIEDHAREVLTEEEPPAWLLAIAARGLAVQSRFGALAGHRVNAPRETRVRMSERDKYFIGDMSLAVSNEQRRLLKIDEDEAGIFITARGTTWRFSAERRDGGSGGTAANGAVLAPMPGRIISVAVAAGDQVAVGQKLVTLEAMKMEHALTAPFEGVVLELEATEGEQVTEGALLVRVARTDE